MAAPKPLLTRYAVVSAQQSGNEEQEEENGSDGTNYGAILRHIHDLIDRSSSVEEAEKKIKYQQHSTTYLLLWEQLKSVRSPATLPWWQEQRVWQTVYADERVFKTENRRDSISYTLTDGTSHFGIVQAIFRHKPTQSSRVLIIRWLQEIEPESGNTCVVKKFGNKRFAYVMRASDVQLDAISRRDIQRIVMIVLQSGLAIARAICRSTFRRGCTN